MNIKDILMYIILMLLIAFTVFNFYALLTSRKRRMAADASYAKEMNEIEDKLLKLMKEQSLSFTKVRRFMNDKGEGIIFASDPDNRKAAIAMRGDILLFSFEDIADAGKEYGTGKKKNKAMSAKVYASVSGTRYVYTIASKPFNPKGLIGKVLFQTTEEFCSELESIINCNH